MIAERGGVSMAAGLPNVSGILSQRKGRDSRRSRGRLEMRGRKGTRADPSMENDP